MGTSGISGSTTELCSAVMDASGGAGEEGVAEVLDVSFWLLVTVLVVDGVPESLVPHADRAKRQPIVAAHHNRPNPEVREFSL